MSLHVDIPTQPQIESLLTTRTPGCVSIYVPTSPLPQESGAARIAFRGLAADAIRQLDDGGRRMSDALREQLDDLERDDGFWSELAIGLAAFATADGVLTFRLANRLTQMVEVSDRFHVKPLLRSVTFPQAGLVLALAQGSVRVVEVAADVPASEVRVPDLPDDVASAIGAASITDRTASGRIQGTEGQKVRMRQYARAVDRALRPMLAGLGLPLILACAEPLDAIYRSVNSYPGLAARGIPGNPETTSDADLAAAARGVLDELHAAELAGLRELYEQRAASGRAAGDLGDVARAATFGAVHTLLADMDVSVPGFVDEATGALTLAEQDDAANYGVVDEIARRVLLSGGRVLAVRRDDVPAAARSPRSCATPSRTLGPGVFGERVAGARAPPLKPDREPVAALCRGAVGPRLGRQLGAGLVAPEVVADHRRRAQDVVDVVIAELAPSGHAVQRGAAEAGGFARRRVCARCCRRTSATRAGRRRWPTSSRGPTASRRR